MLTNNAAGRSFSLVDVGFEDQFNNAMQDWDYAINWSNIAKVVFQRTYPRKDTGKTETFPELISRVIKGNISKIKKDQLWDNEVELLVRFMLQRKAMPAGRGLWMSGAPTHERIGGMALNNCFQGDEEFITINGIKKFKDVVGKRVFVLDRNRSWQETEVKEFGIQPLMEVIVSRYEKKHSIFATPNHKWEARKTSKHNIEEYITQTLPINGYLPIILANQVQELSYEGVAHGITFGDGTKTEYGCKITLCGEKKELKHFFARQMDENGNISYLPDHYKELPAFSYSNNYLAGFFAGILATDGHISSSGSITISNRNIKTIEYLQSLCSILGIDTNEIRTGEIYSNFTNKIETLYVLSIPSYSLPDNFVLRTKHKNNFIRRPKTSKDLWKIIEVKKTNRNEMAYCVNVSTTHTFTLKYNILTGNCSLLTSESWENFVTAMDYLMLGGGVGMSVEHRFTSKLPKIKKDVKIICKNSKDAEMIVPDSREGWCGVVRKVLKSFFESGKSFSYSTICIRGFGEVINGFGGTSSGPIPLIECITNICEILKEREGKHLRPIDCADILCVIGSMVVAGNVRRSAILVLGDEWDKDFLRAKRWDLGVPNYRAMANFSIVSDDIEDVHPLFWKTYEMGEAFGIFNRKNSREFGRIGEKKEDLCMGVNPCQPKYATVLTPEGIKTFADIDAGSIIWSGKKWTKVLKKWSTGIKPVFNYITLGGIFCGTENHKVLQFGEKIEVRKATFIDTELNGIITSSPIHNIVPLEETEVFDITVDDEEHTYWTGCCIVSNCGEATLEDHELCNLQDIFLPNLKDEEEFVLAGKLMHRYGKRVTLENYHNAKTDLVVKRNRRVGTGITGCLQSPLFNPQTLDNVYAEMQKENVSYSKELGIPESIKISAIKPSGTLSLVGDCTPGIHPAFSRYYIRRVRFAANDKLLSILKDSGHPVEPVQKFDGSFDHGTQIASFYCKTPEGTPCSDEGFDTWKQLDTLLMAQRHWSDQAVSVTIYYERKDIPQIKEWLKNNLKNLKSISFLCRNDHGFKQAPMEKIAKETYEKMSNKIKPIEFNKITEGDLESQECSSGACPIK